MSHDQSESRILDSETCKRFSEKVGNGLDKYRTIPTFDRLELSAFLKHMNHGKLSFYFLADQRPQPLSTCPDGLNDVTGDGITCEDINECIVDDICSANSQCVNNDGSYTCPCDAGYEGDGLSGSCVDIDECSSEEDDCNDVSNCVNTAGSYECECHIGYVKNTENICVDIDECETNDIDCGDNAQCSNIAGSFSCTCDSGYYRTDNTCSVLVGMMLEFKSAAEEGYFKLTGLVYSFYLI